MNLNRYSVSAAQPGLSVEVISSLSIPVPPLSEQRDIANYADSKINRTTAISRQIRSAISRLQEYRAH